MKSRLKTCAFIFARGGSKGLPGKNILSIAGTPLVGHAVNIARSLSDVDQVFVSTDSEEIAAVAKDYSALVIDRPASLASDTAPEWLAWQHAIDYVNSHYGEFDCFLSLPATAPLRQKNDVQQCLNRFFIGDVDVVLTVTEASRSPWFNMVKKSTNGIVNLVISNVENHPCRRQDAPQCYDLTTVAYVCRPKFILESSSMWDGIVASVDIPIERSIDIDTAMDFAVACFLMEQWLPSHK